MAERSAEVIRAGGRLRALDGLRFIAALAVVLFHYTGRDSRAWGESVRTVFPSLSRFTVYGDFGPYLFFMISGFVILMSAQGRSIPSFIASRVGRLFPAYWFAVVATGVWLYASDLLPTWERLKTAGVAMNLTMVQSAFGVGQVDGVFWTLWVELKFYVLIGLLLRLGMTRARLLLLCLAWPLAGQFATQAHNDLLVALFEPHFAPFFCIGILLYLVYRQGWSISIGLLLGFNYLAAMLISTTWFADTAKATAGASVSTGGMAALLTGCVLAVCAVTLTPLARLNWRWLTFLGALTYPLYLVHQEQGWIMLRQLTPRLPAHCALAVVIGLMLLQAWLVSRFVERPLGPWLRRFVERDLERALAGPAAATRNTTRSHTTPRQAALRHVAAGLQPYRHRAGASMDDTVEFMSVPAPR